MEISEIRTLRSNKNCKIFSFYVFFSGQNFRKKILKFIFYF
jgi:hypothetical protein